MSEEHSMDRTIKSLARKVANKTARAIPLHLRIEGHEGKIEVIGGRGIPLKKEDEGAGTFFVVLPRGSVTQRKTPLRIGLYEGDKKIDELHTNFLGPVTVQD